MTYNVLLENLVHELGGCGLYQIILASLVHVAKTIAAWSMIFMTFAGQDPGFTCAQRDSDMSTGSIVSATPCGRNISENTCRVNNSICLEYSFNDDMKTLVSEFNLVCDRKWIPATITTIQMGGVLSGCLVSGHIADHIGRKPTYFMAILIIVVFNVAGYFSPIWEVYASMRFLIGVGIGFYLTVQYSLMNEFASSIWRPVLVTTPSWALSSSLYALVAWRLHDWKKIHLAIAITGAPFLLTWWIMPESFRWLVTKQKFSQAEKVVGVVAKVNRTKMPDLKTIFSEAQKEDNKVATTRKYTLLDLFHNREYTKMTIGLLFAWFAASYGFYGMTFGVKSLSGDFYLNLFLINVVEVPVTLLTTFLVQWFGRKKVCFGYYVLAGVTGIAVGVIQYRALPVNTQLTNALALLAKLSVSCGWLAMIVYTTEVYPTVIRTIACGVHSTAARAGAMVAPQIVFIDDEIPGILYFLSGVLMMLSACIMLLFRDTKDAVLEDTLDVEVIINSEHQDAREINQKYINETITNAHL